MCTTLLVPGQCPSIHLPPVSPANIATISQSEADSSHAEFPCWTVNYSLLGTIHNSRMALCNSTELMSCFVEKDDACAPGCSRDTVL